MKTLYTIFQKLEFLVSMHHQYTVKQDRENIILRGEREKYSSCHQLLKHITQFPAEKSCQYFKWQFLLYKLQPFLLKFQT